MEWSPLDYTVKFEEEMKPGVPEMLLVVGAFHGQGHLEDEFVQLVLAWALEWKAHMDFQTFAAVEFELDRKLGLCFEFDIGVDNHAMLFMELFVIILIAVCF